MEVAVYPMGFYSFLLRSSLLSCLSSFIPGSVGDLFCSQFSHLFLSSSVLDRLVQLFRRDTAITGGKGGQRECWQWQQNPKWASEQMVACLIRNLGRRCIFRNERNAVKIQEPFLLSDCLGSENCAHSNCAVLQVLLNFLLLLDAQIMKTPKGIFFHLCLSRCLKTAEQLRISEALVFLKSRYFCSLNK